jgi:hypothetical protein
MCSWPTPLPGLMNGYGEIERRLSGIEEGLTRIERTLGVRPGENAAEDETTLASYRERD